MFRGKGRPYLSSKLESLSAIPLEPKTFSFPRVKATIGLRSPAISLLMLSADKTSVVSASSLSGLGTILTSPPVASRRTLPSSPRSNRTVWVSSLSF